MILPTLLSALFFGVPPLNVPDGSGEINPDPRGYLNLPNFPASPTLKEVEKAAKTFVGIPKVKLLATFDGDHLSVEDRGRIVVSGAPTASSGGFALRGGHGGSMLSVLLQGLKTGDKYLVLLKITGTADAKLRFISAAGSGEMGVPTSPSFLPIGFTAFGKEDGFMLGVKESTKYPTVIGAIEIYSLEN